MLESLFNKVDSIILNKRRQHRYFLLKFPKCLWKSFTEKLYFLPKRNFSKYFVKGALSGLRQFLASKSTLKMMKKTFHCTLRVLFLLKILNFCLHFLVMQKNDLMRKLRLISKLIKILTESSFKMMESALYYNYASAALIQKPANWFAEQINWLVSIWGQH